mmetsp:Transcript_8010/g.31675  ORF Transcript_8010/g.31675 Transcript_8010/m.31675 type:complete len:249 (-) Transcript_8010:88-834(-)
MHARRADPHTRDIIFRTGAHTTARRERRGGGARAAYARPADPRGSIVFQKIYFFHSIRAGAGRRPYSSPRPRDYASQKRPSTEVCECMWLCRPTALGPSSPLVYPPPSSTPGTRSRKLAAWSLSPLTHVYITAPLNPPPRAMRSSCTKRMSSLDRALPHSLSRTCNLTGAPFSSECRPMKIPPVSRSAITMSRYTYPAPPLAYPSLAAPFASASASACVLFPPRSGAFPVTSSTILPASESLFELFEP